LILVRLLLRSCISDSEESVIEKEERLLLCLKALNSNDRYDDLVWSVDTVLLLFTLFEVIDADRSVLLVLLLVTLALVVFVLFVFLLFVLVFVLVFVWVCWDAMLIGLLMYDVLFSCVVTVQSSMSVSIVHLDRLNDLSDLIVASLGKHSKYSALFSPDNDSVVIVSDSEITSI